MKLHAKTAEQRAWLKGRNKFVSGYCNEYSQQPAHEGNKPKTASGKPRKTCPMWTTCPCECHWNVDQLFIMVGKTREEEIPNPEYATPASDFVMPAYPSPVSDDDALPGNGVNGSPDTEHPVNVPRIAAPAPLAQRRTPTGRAARGGLEAQVWDAVTTYLKTPSDEEPITPKLVADLIAYKYSIPTPSSGAVNAVWDRWEKMGYAKQAKKPNRFLEFTGEGTWDELQRIKNSKRTQEKAARSAARRGFR